MEELPTLLAAGRRSRCGSRLLCRPKQSAAPRRQQWFRWVTGLDLRDFVSGFRLYNRTAMEAAASAEATLLDYQDIGTLLLMRRRGLRMTEIALSMHTHRTDRSKIFRSWANAVRYVAVSSLLGIAHGRNTAAAQRPK